MILLPTAYLGNLQYYSKLLSGEACIDLHEHYLKQSYRNRCDILSAGGVMSLTVPVYHTGGVGTPTREIRIDYSKRWQHRHWQAIVSAYRGSPYFAHYEEHFAPLYRQRFDLLTELNDTLQRTVLHLLDPSGGAAARIGYTDRYVSPSVPSDPQGQGHTPGHLSPHTGPEMQTAAPSRPGTEPHAENPAGTASATFDTPCKAEPARYADFRLSLSPKPRLSRPDPTFAAPQYYQVFSDRLPFAGNRSVIDLLFCEGPAAADILRAAHLK